MKELINGILESRSGVSMPGERKITTFLNHYSYQIARKDTLAFRGVERIYCDGFFLCLAFRALGYRVSRKSFDMTSMAPLVFAEAEKQQRSIALIGGGSDAAKTAEMRFRERFPELDIVFCRSGYFVDRDERQSVLDQLKRLNPEIVICGMGTPLQEGFLSDLRDTGWRGAGYTCGGFFHQTASGGIDYYPAWMDKLNLRWLYRIYDEPRLIRRYTIDVFGFLACFFRDYQSGK